jgi:osmotically-inducible protein OsmY
MDQNQLRKTAADARRRVSHRDTSTRRSALWAALGGIVGGVLGALLLDPQRGKARRAQIADQGAATVRRAVRGMQRQARRVGSDVEGAAHALQHRGGGAADLNDAALAGKVQSELFADPAIPKGDINVNVERGIVVLRGEVSDVKLGRELERAAARIPGVLGVQNLLHVPGEPASVLARQSAGS